MWVKVFNVVIIQLYSAVKINTCGAVYERDDDGDSQKVSHVSFSSVVPALSDAICELPYCSRAAEMMLDVLMDQIRCGSKLSVHNVVILELFCRQNIYL